MGHALCTCDPRSNPAYVQEYDKFARGIGHRKLDLTQPTSMFVSCRGTQNEVQEEIYRMKVAFKVLRQDFNGLDDLNLVLNKMIEINLVIAAEWRTLFRFNRIDINCSSDLEMQQVADLGYHPWRRFNTIINGMLKTPPESWQNGFKGIAEYIWKQEQAILKLNEKKKSSSRCF